MEFFVLFGGLLVSNTRLLLRMLFVSSGHVEKLYPFGWAGNPQTDVGILRPLPFCFGTSLLLCVAELDFVAFGMSYTCQAPDLQLMGVRELLDAVFPSIEWCDSTPTHACRCAVYLKTNRALPCNLCVVSSAICHPDPNICVGFFRSAFVC
jgi:hypothetical protein